MTISYPLTLPKHWLDHLQQLEQVSLSIKDTTSLNPLRFKLVRFNEGGYAVVLGKTIIEYDLTMNLLINKNDQLFYHGPLQLFVLRNNEKEPVPMDENNNEPQLKWIGIEPKRFKGYRKWINRDDTCGMYTAAVVLAYYKDYIDDKIVTESLYPYRSNQGERLIMAMKVYIKNFAVRGTIAYNISWGVNRFFKDYKTSDRLGYKIKAIANITPTYGIVSTRLTSNIPKPVIVGLYSWLGSPKNYKNHWVVAYAMSNDEENRYYRVHDNHGRYQAVVNVDWTVSSVRLTRSQIL